MWEGKRAALRGRTWHVTDREELRLGVLGRMCGPGEAAVVKWSGM